MTSEQNRTSAGLHELRIEIPSDVPQSAGTSSTRAAPPPGRPPSPAARRAVRPESPPLCAHPPVHGEVDGDTACFICAEDDAAAPLIVGQACGCRSLAVHGPCLERWINFRAAHAQSDIDKRLVCLICAQTYRLPYEVTNVPPAPAQRPPVLVKLKHAAFWVAWVAFGGGLATLCFQMQVSRGLDDAGYRMAMVALCVYAVVSVCLYLCVLQRAERAQVDRESRASPTYQLRFTGAPAPEQGEGTAPRAHDGANHGTPSSAFAETFAPTAELPA